MGKSPGKWIKTVLFGKKYSKSNFSKNVSPDKKTATKTPVEDPSPNPLVISDPYPLTEIGVETLELERGASGHFPVSFSDADMKRREEAAAMVQATFRGYLARRAFRALKGIIRLQALIRGHLVRRQAVATLRCMLTIIKLQAMIRGHKDAKHVSVGAKLVFGWQKLATNTFVRRLLVKMSTDIPLTLQYDADEPNSSWNWIQRWSVSHLSEQPKQAKKTTKPKPKRKSLGPQTAQPTSELERNKRNLRKVSSSSSAQVPDKPGSDSEKPQLVQSVEVAKSAPTHEVPALEIAVSLGNLANPDGVVDNPGILETPLKSDHVDATRDGHPAVENGVKMQSCLNLDNDTSIKEEQVRKEGQKAKKRRSLPAKQEFTEKISQNLPSVPSYMAATESAKAKLRAQESTPKIEEDGAEYGGSARRHSLPASTNGKSSTLSPRVQKPAKANGKRGNKTSALKASRDDNVVLPGWRK